jgi:hypothetical protein
MDLHDYDEVEGRQVDPKQPQGTKSRLHCMMQNYEWRERVTGIERGIRTQSGSWEMVQDSLYFP